MDIYSKEKRSNIMARVKGTDSIPELTVRRMLHGLGYRYRLHQKNLPGKPDIVLSKYKSLIFIHGCFWHHHNGCKKSRLPQSNKEFWRKKILDNTTRDQRSIQSLMELGWKVMVIWECELKEDFLAHRLNAFLRGANGNFPI
jgi:DNA mismatch endonuclease (patch repair protein)